MRVLRHLRWIHSFSKGEPAPADQVRLRLAELFIMEGLVKITPFICLAAMLCCTAPATAQYPGGGGQLMQASYQGYQPVYGGGYQMGQYLGGPDIVPAAYTEMGEQGYGCPPGGCGNDVYGHGGCGHGGCHSCSSG